MEVWEWRREPVVSLGLEMEKETDGELVEHDGEGLVWLK